MVHSSSLRAACLATAAITLTGLAAPASADVTASSYVNSSIYDYRVTYMTDIDQRRTGLRSSGDMFCVPTSCLNLFAYAANHGFPVGGLPPANYMSNAQHGYMTTWIDFIGDLMNTDGQAGTTCCVNDAYQSLVNGSLLKRKLNYINSEFTPSQASMSQIACNGWIVSFTYGFYVQDGTFLGYPIYLRGGGHAVTLTRSTRQGSTRIIKYRDPSNNSSLTTQSGSANKVYNPTTVTGWIGAHGLRNMTRLFDSDSGNPRFIDSLHCIRPIFGVAFLNSDDSQGGGSIKILDPIPFEGAENSMVPEATISPFLNVLDVSIHPDATSGLVIAKSIFTLSRLRTLDLKTGQMTILGPSPPGLVKMDWSGKGKIYTFDLDGDLYALDAEGNVVLDTTLAVPLPAAIAVDDPADAVWIVSVTERKLVKLSSDLSQTLLTLNIPTSVPMSGDAELIVDPTSGFPWLHTDASNTIYGIKANFTHAPTIYPVSLGTVDSMSISDDRLYVTANGVIKVFQPTAAAPGWSPDATSPFAGLPGGSRIAMLRNSTNYDPALHSGPEWQNIPPSLLNDPSPDTQDCLADHNDDGVVDASDLSVLLGAWGTTGDTGDLNQDGIVNGADLAALLGAWGVCPG